MSRFSRALRLVAAIGLFLTLAYSQTAAGGSIEGVVLDGATGQGIKGALVRIQTNSGDPRSATADAQGNFRFDGLEAGSYQIRARYPGFADANGNLESGFSVAVPAPRGTPARARIVMERYGAITGKVTGPGGIPVERRAVEAYKRVTEGRRGVTIFENGYQYERSRSATTDERGEYRIAPLSPGLYLLRFPATSPMALDMYYPQASKPSEAKTIELSGGDELRADAQIAPQTGVTVSGHILGAATGANLRIAVGHEEAVRQVPARYTNAWAAVAATGDTYTLRSVPPGKRIIWAEQYANDGDSMNDWGAAARREIDVGNTDIGGFDLTLQPAAHVETSVSFESGCVPAEVQIDLRSEGDYVFHAVQERRSVSPSMARGKYRVSATTGGGGYKPTSVKLGDAEVPADGFDLAPGATAQLHITMGCAGR